MNMNFWSHRNGFRSPTEQQLVRWETDGGNYRDYEDAVLFDGRLYSNQAELLRARAQAKIKQVVGFLHERLDARLDFHRPTTQQQRQLP